MQNDSEKKITVRDLLSVLWRALFLQASWSFERMQALGFAYALQPVLRKLYPDPVEFEARLKLHREYFNTQPYLASFILGAVVRLEEERASGRDPAGDIQCLKATLMPPLGALGDSFFWGSLKPFAAVTAVALAMTGSWWAPVLFLLLFNVGHIGLRTAVLFRGYASSGDAVALMTWYRFTKAAKLLKVLALCVLGGIVGMLPAWSAEFKPTFAMDGFLLMLSGIAVVVLLILVLRRGASPIQLMLGLAVLCLVLAYAGVF